MTNAWQIRYFQITVAIAAALTLSALGPDMLGLRALHDVYRSALLVLVAFVMSTIAVDILRWQNDTGEYEYYVESYIRPALSALIRAPVLRVQEFRSSHDADSLTSLRDLLRLDTKVLLDAFPLAEGAQGLIIGLSGYATSIVAFVFAHGAPWMLFAATLSSSYSLVVWSAFVRSGVGYRQWRHPWIAR